MSDVAIAAAVRLSALGGAITAPESMNVVAGPDWHAFFGKDYSVVERHAIFCYAYSAVDTTASGMERWSGPGPLLAGLAVRLG